MKPKSRWIFSVSLLVVLTVVGAVHLVMSPNILAVRFVPTTHKVVALTIDDGPQPETTPRLLRTLKEKQAKATFFILGANAARHPDLVRQAASDGHEIGSHAYSHNYLNKMSPAEFEAEMEQTNQLIRQLAAQEPKVFRPPGGAWNDAIAIAAQLRGQITILWSVDAGDWRRPSVGGAVNRILKNVKPGSIVLLHDGQPSLPTPEVVGIVIDTLREQGYQFVTVSELLQYYEVR